METGSSGKRIHLIGGTMAAGGAVEAAGTRRPRIRPERLPADERLPRIKGIRTMTATRPTTSRATSIVVVGNAISRGNSELRDGPRAQINAARCRGDPGPVPLGCARSCWPARTARLTTVADRMAVGARKPRSDGARRHRAQLRRRRIRATAWARNRCHRRHEYTTAPTSTRRRNS